MRSMWQKSSMIIGGLAIAYAALSLLPNIRVSPAHSETFDARWIPEPSIPEPSTTKGDRLAAPTRDFEAVVFGYSKTDDRTTVIAKILRDRRMENRPRARRIREQEEIRSKPLVGCEPAFSAVIVPSMANVAGRCVS